MQNLHSETGQNSASQDETIIWGAKAIGDAVGRSPSFVRNTLAQMPASPIRQLNGKYWVQRRDLFAFFDRLANKGTHAH